MATCHVLGSAGYHPNEHRHTTCLAIPELGVVLDAGTGFFRLRNLLPKWAGDTVEVLLSHAHLDHVIGLTFFLDVAWPGDGQPRRPIRTADEPPTGLTHKFRVHGDPRHLAAVKDRLFGGPLFPLHCTFELHAVEPIFALGRGTVRTIGMQHPGGSVGYRLSHPALAGDVAFVTDTRAPLVPTAFVAGVRTLIVESNFTDDLAELAAVSWHTTAREALALGRAAGAAQTLLIHHNPLLEQLAGKALPDPLGLGAVPGVTQARDGMVLEV